MTTYIIRKALLSGIKNLPSTLKEDLPDLTKQTKQASQTETKPNILVNQTINKLPKYVSEKFDVSRITTWPSRLGDRWMAVHPEYINITAQGVDELDARNRLIKLIESLVKIHRISNQPYDPFEKFRLGLKAPK